MCAAKSYMWGVESYMCGEKSYMCGKRSYVCGLSYMCGTDFYIIVLQKLRYLSADNKSANGHPYTSTVAPRMRLKGKYGE